HMYDKIKKIKNLRGRLSEFSLLFSTVRGPEILKGECFVELAPLLKEVPAIIGDNNHFFSKEINPILPVLEKVEEKLAPFGKNEISNGLGGVRWCLDHGLTQQGITLLQEVIVTVILGAEKIDSLKFENRQFVSEYIGTIEKIRNGKKLKKLEKLKQEIGFETAGKIEGSRVLKDLASSFNTLRKDRNDISHAGFRKNGLKGKKFREHLEETFSKVEEKISCI
ncbi:MAG: hypothetical protein ACE5FU_09765, partial [Nitrospinota bacterium]